MVLFGITGQDEHRSGNQLRWQPLQIEENPQNDIGWPSIEDRRLIEKSYKSHIDRKFGQEEAVRYMGAALYNNRTQALSRRCFIGVFEKVFHE